MWCLLSLCCWGLGLASGWTTFQQTPWSRNFSFTFFPPSLPSSSSSSPSSSFSFPPSFSRPGVPPPLSPPHKQQQPPPPLPPPPPAPAPQDATENKVEKLGQDFKRNVRKLREKSSSLDLVFLVDESSSVGHANFLNELKFVKKLLSDFPVVPTATRVAIVTFSSKNNVVPRVDYISSSQAHQHKCSLLNREIPAITYRGGGTYTKGAFQQAAQILRHSRENATKVIFLITDGYSNGGDPRPIATSLREFGVEIFTFGIWQGNIRELNDMASSPKEEHCYLLHSFAEFEALARRALHEDLPSGSYIQEDISHCSYLCEAGKDCCDIMASCKCGTHSGQFECICEKGYFGRGLQHECTACPTGTYKPEGSPGGISTCIPCPDENHISPPGSTSPEDCVCKEGYHLVGQTCEVVHCPVLQAPENGYFIQNVCNNYFNSACGIRCHSGYKLVGSSIRLCQSSGMWSGSDSTCQARSCRPLRKPEGGHISCTAGETTYNTVCYVSCDEGYKLIGVPKLTCKDYSQWDYAEPHCEEILCPTLGKPSGVMMYPSNCGQTLAKIGTVCQLSCSPGFILSGTPGEITCTISGEWNSDAQTAVCKDVEAPQIECPDNIKAETLEQQDSANISWEIPKAKDNSGEQVSIRVTPAFTPPYLFPIGEVVITYTAMDRSSNQASCTFVVKVVDIEPPVIDRCRSPPPIQVSENEYGAMWEEPQFSDNSGASLTITRSHSPGDLFPHGETTVQYTATDPSGNNRTCEIHIIIKGSPCEVPFTPVNGDLKCRKDSVGLNCTLSCLEGYDFTEGSTEKYYCAFEDGIWKPPYSTEWPDCALNRFANHGFKSFEMLYKATRCDDRDLLENFSEAFESALGKMVPSFCSDVDDIDCKLEDLTRKHCLEYNYDYENGFAIGPGGWGAANRLDYSYDDFLEEMQKRTQKPARHASSRFKRHERPSIPLSDHKIKLIFNITASVPLPAERNDTLESENQQRLLKTLETITNRLKRTLNKEPMYSFQLASDLVVADSNSLETEKAFLFCRPGSVLRGRMCVNCPLGTYYSLEHTTCESCWIGSYQDEEGQLECKLCPSGSYTEYLHSRSLSECKAQCKQGTYSSNGLETCESCPFGTYQPAFGSRSCVPCPKHTSTVKRGAVDISACGVPCPVGEFSRSGLIPCYPCPRDYYQPDPGKSFCLSCPFYGTTTITGARSITDCSSFSSTFSAAEESIRLPASPGHITKKYQVFHECFRNPCHNSGTCEQVGSGYICACPPGYTGVKCEVDINECSSSPCLNNGVCKDGIKAFTCHCQAGFTGLLCQENINECLSDPCLNEGECIDEIDGYHCSCTNAFTGTHCEIEINECNSDVCLNDAPCEDGIGRFICKCLPGFSGVMCEENLDDCLSRPCKNGATCIDGINSFRCQCVKGYTGLQCEDNINECASNPCRNQATCVDSLNSYVCKCRPGFTGSRCETELSAGFNLNFEVSGIYGYVMLDGVLPSLSAITCAFWMKSSDIISYGTPISYALENGSDNTFLLTDYNGWVLYVNGKERITDCPSVNDGSWHHITVTWTSIGGAWKVYIDGKLSDGGTGLSVGTTIPGGGALVLGQEQDKRGEGFNPAESFVGSLSQLNIWDYILTPQQVKTLATSCPRELSKGNILAWPDFLSGVVGKVKIDSKSIFCADCPSLEGSIPHLRVSSADLKPGSKVSLFCDPGFQIVGNPMQHCLNQGQWTQPLPHCERISCGVPPPLENGFYSAEDFYAGSTVTYQCNNGYYLLGDSRMFCTDNGSWNGISPSCLDVDECAVGSDCDEHASCHNTNGSYVCTCIPPYTGNGKKCAEPIKCKDPGNPENGHSFGEIFSVGSEVTFSCEEGYQLMGVSKLTCLESGEWNHLIPYCEAVTCGGPVTPENGGVEGSIFTFGNKVTYSCNKGYNMVGGKEALCLASGTWSHSPPKCELVKCSSPQDIVNGKYILSGVTYLSTASYSCNSGYSLQGTAVLHCEASAQWNEVPPSCELVSCGPPPAIKDAATSRSNFTFGNKVTYTCKEGYTLVGPETIECLANGKWSVSNQQCLAVSCDEPPNVDHASPETAHRLFGDIAFYYCSDGYSLAGNAQLLCNAQGQWVPPEGQEMPHCIADFCEKPPAVSYSILESVSKAKFAAGSAVSFKCTEGFVLNTSAKIECVRGGHWNPSPMTIQCIPVRCGEPPSIKNGYASGGNYSFGAVVAYSCNKGFYIKGEKKSTCEATGEWSGRIPTCHPVSCSEPPKVENGLVEHMTGRVFESEVRYQCNPGYKLLGSPGFVCQANRHWHSESPPSCIPLSCGKPPPIQHGYAKGENFEVGSKVQFLCNEGYELMGDATWTCQKSGKWNKKLNPKCIPAKCPEPPLVENQLVLKELVNEVGVVQFSCKEGQVLQGSSVLKCLPSQQWNDSFPACKTVLCFPPPLISFGGPTPSSALHFGSMVKYSCVDGFFLRGAVTISCQSDGTWSSPLPECIPVECPQPEEILNGIVDVQGLDYLSTALYTCKPGFELMGNTTILCGESGQWLGGKPVCKPIECPKPRKILNGKYSYTNLHYGQTITYSCDRGYRLVGPNVLVCLETGDWDVVIPSCSAILCEPPQPIENGFVEGADYSFGAMIIYSCFPGFQLAGHAMQTCEESGWSSFTPTCFPTDCGLPPHIDFGESVKIKGGARHFDPEEEVMEVSYHAPSPSHHPGLMAKGSKEPVAAPLSNFLYGSMVLYTCDPGHELLGNPVLICQEDGTWNGSAPACLSIECDLPTPPQNGFLHFTENILGSALQYSCKPGHMLVGSDTRLCLSTRQWSDAPPTCEAISCNKPSQLMNGSVRGRNYTYMSMVHYACDPGYELNGSERRTCQEDQKWDGNEPICIPVSCGPPPVSENGRVSGEEYTFQREIEYSCKEGFLLDGTRSQTCLANGHWSGAPPTCVAVKCTAPLPLENGEMKGLEHGFGKEVEYQCQEGFVLQGAPKLTCQADGTWDAEPPYCEPVSCGPPEDLSHGFLNGSSFTYGDQVEYVCFPGYELLGSPIRHCLASGSWSGTLPSCLPCKCPPPVIQNGVVTGKDFTCGQGARFQCLEGFKLLGPSEIVCEAAGKWSSGFPHCGRLSCGSPPMIPNAFINGSGSLEENAITYNCVTGYRMQGVSDLICTETGLWSEPYPNCELLSCGPPPSVPNAIMTGDIHTYGSKVQYRCLEGYVMESDTDTCMCLKDGHWSPKSISCSSKKCPMPTNMTHVLIEGDDFSINNRISVSCTEGYIFLGTNISTCQLDGTWDPPFSDDSCAPVSCGKPETPDHGLVVGTKYSFKNSVRYQCEAGYELEGDGERICQENKQWSGVLAVCKRASCGPPEDIENGSVQGQAFLFEDEVLYTCNQGYELQGPSRRICHVNKKWSPSAPTCVSIICESPPSVENAFFTSMGNAYQNSIAFVCNPGYHLVGPPNIMCLANRTWSRPFPSCEETKCEVPIGLVNGKTAYENNTVGSKVTYSCNRGYSLEGEHSAECTASGIWTYPAPFCKPNPCPVPFIIPENAVLSETEFYVGQNVSVKCREGYMLQGQAVITCSPDETWTPTSAKCEKISCGPPTHIENAIARGTSYQYGDLITYSCYSGYMLEGSLRSVCLENRTWTPPPTCRAVCRFPCQNGGVCQRPNACTCPEGWMGRLCEEPICILPCLNGGRCVAPYRCDCPAGWTGSRCHTAVCQSPCLNGGKCVRPNRCYCLSAWTGHDCSRKRKSGFSPF
ncbi:sushi, von Willebrand factor type A, EGF and pentraxin domain-containing protein 1 isoform X8 [Ornithorhynchus anatinus]|uniref:sushi, von Willebrand factor type A, EGF and pentraxin domain-containing protein 1 isoform X8 n=1 Tax=Ornithorhynchus anatinus TaxID=9258 RepID=UPI0010A752FE|nr:sushi, von Willebrand factor type A, EGF and pentraxin domain-containing protein 1 isoform X8 [Ornithorhynchus anatinus]